MKRNIFKGSYSENIQQELLENETIVDKWGGADAPDGPDPC